MNFKDFFDISQFYKAFSFSLLGNFYTRLLVMIIPFRFAQGEGKLCEKLECFDKKLWKAVANIIFESFGKNMNHLFCLTFFLTLPTPESNSVKLLVYYFYLAHMFCYLLFLIVCLSSEMEHFLYLVC